MKILSAGISSIQDLGRPGYRNKGIHTGGVIDRMAARIANLLAANDDDAALIEISAGRWSAISSFPKLIAVAGNGHRVWLGAKEISLWQPFLLPPETILRVEAVRGGYAFVAIHGGIRSKTILDSRSTHLAAGFGGCEGRLLKSGDEVPTAVLVSEEGNKIISLISGSVAFRSFRLSHNVTPDYRRSQFRFFAGQESVLFTAAARSALVSDAFEITGMSNRMGMRLNGIKLQTIDLAQLISTAVSPGTMQVSPDGQILVLLADAQTTGGYPRIGQLASVDMGPLAQQKPGTLIHFQQIRRDEAEDLFLKQEADFRQLRKDYQLYFS